jgi:peptidoglycan/LPS O-acetylase OafA/YrhL
MVSKNIYFPYLDGLRAIAVILVLLVHSDFFIFNTGWIGVPVFFVLSGFLITRILLENKLRENYFKTFYYRRVLRIFPIYYLLLLGCLAWGFFMDFHVSQFFYYFFYLQSFTISRNIQPIFSNGLMGHTWSLSVEEIFYLVWPAIIFIFDKKNITRLCVALSVFSLLFKLYHVSRVAETVAMLSIAGNLDCLMAGALLALYFSVKSGISFTKRHRNWTYFFAALTVFFLTSQYLNLQPGAVLLCRALLSVTISWLTYLLILYLITPGHKILLLRRVFSNVALTYIGKISYGIYLYHIPVYMFISSLLYHYHLVINPVLEFSLDVVLTIAVAVISWQLIEKPILLFKYRLSYKEKATGERTVLTGPRT